MDIPVHQTTRRCGFDNEKYLREQTRAILERIERFGRKLYLEFGGKLLYDYHAARVLPGFDPNVKMRLLQELKERAEIILCIHEQQHGIHAGYAKFETFPIWNLPVKHPFNVACEAATADLQDVNMIDPFHLEACGETAVNYNRDIGAFPVLTRILARILGASSLYRSPTDMGVNRASVPNFSTKSLFIN